MERRRTPGSRDFNFNDIEEVKKIFDTLVEGEKEEKKKKPKEAPKEKEEHMTGRLGVIHTKDGKRLRGVYEMGEEESEVIRDLYKKIVSGYNQQQRITRGGFGRRPELESFEKFCGYLIMNSIVHYIEHAEKLAKNPTAKFLKMVMDGIEQFSVTLSDPNEDDVII